MQKKTIITAVLFFIGINISIGQSNEVLKGHCHIDQANKYNTYLNYGESIHYYELGIEVFSNIFEQTHPLLAINYAAIGQAFLDIGNIEKAKLYCQNGLENIEKSFPNGAISSTCLTCLGLIAQTEKDYSDALNYYEKALEINNQLWGENAAASSNLYLLFGNFYLEQNQFQQALVYFEKVKILNETNNEVDTENYLAQYYEAIGNWFFRQNNLDKANISFNKSIEIYKKINGAKHPSVAKIYLKMGDVFYQKNELNQAIQQYDFSYNSFQDYDKKSFQIEGYDTCRCNATLIAGMLGKAMTFEQKYAQYKTQTDLEKALNHYKRAAEKVNQSVQFFGKDALHRQQIIHQHKNIFVNAVRVSYELFQLTNDEIYIQKSFDLVNNYKALTLQIERKQTLVMREDIPQSILEEQEKWKVQIANLKLEIYQATTENAPILRQKKQELLNIMTKQATFLRTFKADYWYVEDSVFSQNLVAFKTIPTLLNEQSILLNYVFDESRNQIFIFSFTNEKTNFQAIKIPQNFSKHIKKFHHLLQSSLLARLDKKQRFIEQSNELYQYLIEPVANLIDGKKRLIIIRDDVLHLLPFDVLLKDNQSNDFQNLNYLIKDFEIVYHYSTGLWKHSQKQQWQGAANSLLAFAPVFDDVQNITLTTRSKAFRCFVQDEIQIPLPHSETEVIRIQQVLGTTDENTILLRSEASKVQLINHLKTPHRFVHIASHSFANYDNILFSGIACFMNENANTKNAMLYINEIENLKIPSDLVVLSSCESGVGQLLSGEGLLGINRSFIHAGVPNTLFSLWKVQDEATALLMIEFYKNVQQNMDYSQALQQAKLTLLQNPKTATPIFWASFILMGR